MLRVLALVIACEMGCSRAYAFVRNGSGYQHHYI